MQQASKLNWLGWQPQKKKLICFLPPSWGQHKQRQVPGTQTY